MPKDTLFNFSSFKGFEAPKTTATPDLLFDEIMPFLNEAELKVLLYIVRRTFGFKKDDDNISLNQLVDGITARDGHRIDRGTGLSKSAVKRALQSLKEKNLIHATHNTDPKKGNLPTTYSLRLDGDPRLSDEPTPRPASGPTLGSLETPPLAHQRTPQETVRQETEVQQHGVVDELAEYGVSRGVAERLSKNHSADYIRAKLDWVKDLAERSPKSVGRNRAGFLTKAIEEDYQPDSGYQTPEQRAEEAQAQARRQADIDAAIRAEDARREAERTRERERRAQALAAVRHDHPTAQIEGTTYTTETLWRETLERLRFGMTATNFQTWFTDTLLASCTDRSALIVGPSGFIVDHLRSRFSGLIQRQLSELLGHRVELEYVALSDLTAEHYESEPATRDTRVEPTTQPNDSEYQRASSPG